jgi:aldehyde:ferredoxin oxidoreductase
LLTPGDEKLMQEVFHDIQHEVPVIPCRNMEPGTRLSNLKGILPTRNFQRTTFDKIEQIDGDAMLRTIYSGRGHVQDVDRMSEGGEPKPYSVSSEYEFPV